MIFQCINIRQVPRKVLKTAASGLGFQHLPRDLANVNARKTMFDPYNVKVELTDQFGRSILGVHLFLSFFSFKFYSLFYWDSS